MTPDHVAELRSQRDQLTAELARLNASIESLRKQHEEESGIGDTIGSDLAVHEEAFDEARHRIAELSMRYQRLVAEERALRERIQQVRERHGG